MNSDNKPQEVEINADLAMDIELILNGGFSPLTTFLDKKSLDSVLKNMKHPSGEIWSMPILFPKLTSTLSWLQIQNFSSRVILYAKMLVAL